MADHKSLLEQVVAELTEYFVGDRTLGDTLHRVAELTMRALPQTTHVGITMMVHGQPGTAIFTHPDTPEIDQAQYQNGTGPCLDAFRDGRPYVIESMFAPGDWQPFRDSAAEHGVLSSLSLPLITQHGPIGALNLYADTEQAYGPEDLDVGSRFAFQAAFVLANAQAYWDARTLSENLELAMASRATIEQAKGMIMGAQGVSADEAMELLVRQSQHQNVKVRDLAAEIVRSRTQRPHL